MSSQLKMAFTFLFFIIEKILELFPNTLGMILDQHCLTLWNKLQSGSISKRHNSLFHCIQIHFLPADLSLDASTFAHELPLQQVDFQPAISTRLGYITKFLLSRRWRTDLLHVIRNTVLANELFGFCFVVNLSRFHERRFEPVLVDFQIQLGCIIVIKSQRHCFKELLNSIDSRSVEKWNVGTYQRIQRYFWWG